MTTWSEAPESLVQVVEALVSTHHPHLEEARIGVVLRDTVGSSRGVPQQGGVQLVGAVHQVLLDLDFLVWVAADAWSGLTLSEKLALLDHQLCHCQMSQGRCYLRGHDVEEFQAIIERYGSYTPALQQAEEGLREASLRRLVQEGEMVLNWKVTPEPIMSVSAETEITHDPEAGGAQARETELTEDRLKEISRAARQQRKTNMEVVKKMRGEALQIMLDRPFEAVIWSMMLRKVVGWSAQEKAGGESLEKIQWALFGHMLDTDVIDPTGETAQERPDQAEDMYNKLLKKMGAELSFTVKDIAPEEKGKTLVDVFGNE